MPQRLIDISRVIADGGVVYPGDDPLKMERHWQIGPDCPFNMTRLQWMSHFLTHLDPPLHFFPNGQSLDEIPLERFMGEALVREVAGDCVRGEDIPAAEEIGGKNLLLKTRNSKAFDPRRYDEHHVYLTAGAARAAVEHQVNLVGFDYLSVDRFGDSDFPVHRTLLGAGVLILEGIDLSAVAPGRYRLIALPLRIAQGDGSPVRAVLLAD
jgi:arylformamidase